MAEEVELVEHLALAFDYGGVIHHLAEAKHARGCVINGSRSLAVSSAPPVSKAAGHAGGNHNKNGKGSHSVLVKHILNSVRTAYIRNLMRVGDDRGGAFFQY